MKNTRTLRNKARQVCQKTRLLFVLTIWLHLIISLEAGYFISPWHYLLAIGIVALAIFIGVSLVEWAREN